MMALTCMFNNSKIWFREEQYQIYNYAHEDFLDLLLVVPASFKLA